MAFLFSIDKQENVCNMIVSNLCEGGAIMWVLILIVVLFLIFKPSKEGSSKAKRKKTTMKTNSHQPYSKEKHKAELRKQKDMNKLTSEGELPFGWVLAYEDFIKNADNEVMYFYEEYHKNQYGEPLKKYAALKSLVIYFEDAKRIYAKRGECFLYWFENMWAKEDEVRKLTDELKYMEAHMDELIQQEKVLKKLRTDLKEIIKAEPGVKQEQLYKRFSPELKNHISNELYNMAANGVIRREKSGRTYALFMQ